MTTWGDLEVQFRQMQQQAPELRVDHQWSDDDELWSLAGPAAHLGRERFRALAALAGRRLRESARELVPGTHDPKVTDEDLWYRAVAQLVAREEEPLVARVSIEGKEAGFVH